MRLPGLVQGPVVLQPPNLGRASGVEFRSEPGVVLGDELQHAAGGLLEVALEPQIEFRQLDSLAGSIQLYPGRVGVQRLGLCVELLLNAVCSVRFRAERGATDARAVDHKVDPWLLEARA